MRALLEAEEGPAGRRRRWWIVGAILLAAAAAVLVVTRAVSEPDGPRYVTEPVVRDTLVVTVSATGNLQPTNQVSVGSELSGIVEAVNVDVNDRVTRGQVLARLDVAKLEDAVARSQANLAAARARVLQTEATATEARANLARSQRVSELSGGKVPSPSELEAVEATGKRAAADVALARAEVSQARAQLASDRTNLGKASIRSPIDGVVLSRDVDPGQTVAAAFQAPVLFTLAEDLTKMELQVDVDEADVGQVEQGQRATFTVDAWPGRRYDAVITRVGYGSQEKDGVISYLALLEVSNEDLSLRPGMTGTAEITTLVRERALLVPNAAVRFAPSTGSATAQGGGSVFRQLVPRPPRALMERRGQRDGPPGVWVLRDGEPVRIDVRVGASNGRLTEIVGGDLEEGAQVITEAVGPRT